ncbi:MAG: class I SAM-dependent methyltransferase [Deltaproteobacteria bacterium]|nr:class I SAM-dependent methyltransferase [Deltaproteobacteria bacterium]
MKKPALSGALLDLHTDILPCLRVQNCVYGPFDYPFLQAQIQAAHARRVLDVGTADGSFLRELARQLSEVLFHGIDANGALVQHGRRQAARASAGNITITDGFFDHRFSTTRYDLIMARFAIEHVPDVKNFLAAVAARLRSRGRVAIVEYYVEIAGIEDPTWREFRARELRLYRKIHSHPQLAFQLPSLLADVGFTNVQTSLHVVSPSTVGWKQFAALVGVYTSTYATIDRRLWSPPFVKKIQAWLRSGHHVSSRREPSFLISHTAARKK